MAEKSIRLRDHEVRAVLDDSKTQFRVVVNFELNKIHSHFGFTELPKENQKLLGDWPLSGIVSLENDVMTYEVQTDVDDSSIRKIRAPYSVGDRLWVREAFHVVNRTECACYEYCSCPPLGTIIYKADEPGLETKWKPSIHMPREASRITLEVTARRCERLNDISEADAIAEGIRRQATDGYGHVWYGASDTFDIDKKGNPISGLDYVSAFSNLWESIHGPGSFDEKWVWVYTFRRVQP